ncbi:UDP-N-acetylmuramate dehydrogenase [Aggregatibacter actinomycetemcomitans]|uniref:UDP-N-acetylmuramate dehydrogenase n=1 Tax=Aggregatibacter actinomycetemcomitans TaxID=714 RepID=UPI00197B723B|nr:UDP-N-acetylmuramate dehydrogenase [Aggregatibacter actinomycetemcomitans]MBN6074332.1 UDP-N-acetylmuramate dehydrogenase [Aggregatibacter actinomycetemcomitans]
MQNLQPFHTFSIPAQAQKLIEITSVPQLKQVWEECQRENLPVLFLGQGSNVLFVEDFAGAVLINRLRGIAHKEDDRFHYLHVNGGEVWHDLVQWSIEQGFYGLENLALIPGCAGSAPIQNIGAYGVEFKDVCDYVEVLDLTSAEQFRLSCEECEFGYRESVFKHKYAQGYVVTAIGLKLAKNWKPVLKYGNLVNLDKSAVSSADVFAEVCAVRQSKLPDPKQFGNAGSFFKNPVVAAQQFARLKEEYPAIPNFPQADGSVKLAAGWLIDQCGLKGYQIGGAAVHQQQALVIINKGNATASDVVELAHHIYQLVALRFDVRLQPEVRFIGKHGEVDSQLAIS